MARFGFRPDYEKSDRQIKESNIQLEKLNKVYRWVRYDLDVICVTLALAEIWETKTKNQKKKYVKQFRKAKLKLERDRKLTEEKILEQSVEETSNEMFEAKEV